MKKCDEVLIQLVIREYDEEGNPIGEAVSQQLKVFRNRKKDFWEMIDEFVGKHVESTITTH